MLEPHVRRLLLESFRPPAGFQLDWALGTTYTLDLTALLAAPVAFAFADFEDGDGRPLLNPLALLKAVRQYADRMLLFCQAGKIQVPGRYQHLLADLENSVVEAFAPRGGSFHPKLWFLRYVGNDGEVLYRVLVLSRNMTFDRSWDTRLCLEGRLADRSNAIARNHPLGEFVEALPRMSRRHIAPAWKHRIKQLAYEIRRVEFEEPEPFEELRFWPLGHDVKNRWPFPDRIDRMLVVSPFLGDALLGELLSSQSPIELVSRAECLERLTSETLRTFKHVWVLDETAEPEAAESEETTIEPARPSDDKNDRSPLPVKKTAPASEDGAQSLPLVGLHAKVYVCDAGWNAHLWTGSANATSAAFERNVEFLVELAGKKSKCGVDAVLGRNVSDGNGKRPTCLADLLQPYKPCASHPETADEEEFERQVDELAKQLAGSAPVANCEQLDGVDRFALVVTSAISKELSNSELLLVAWPISLRAMDAREVDIGGDEWMRFEPVTALGLTSFFAFQASSHDRRFARSFVLNIPLENAPADRREQILRHLLSDQDRVLKFLLLLLSGGGADDFVRLLGSGTAGAEANNLMQSMFGLTLFESLIQALDRDPGRIDQVAAIIADLRMTPDGQKLLPDDLEAVWEPIQQVRVRQMAQADERRHARRERGTN